MGSSFEFISNLPISLEFVSYIQTRYFSDLVSQFKTILKKVNEIMLREHIELFRIKLIDFHLHLDNGEKFEQVIMGVSVTN